MCRIFGYVSGIASDPKLLSKALFEFQKLAVSGLVPSQLPPGHADGWGISAHKDGELYFYTRFPGSAIEGKSFEAAVEIITKGNPDIVIAHLRKTSVGGNTFANTQPFVKGNVSFCHNGTITYFNPDILKGKSDSLQFFKEFIDAPDPLKEFENFYHKVVDSGKFRGMHMLVSDGRKLLVAKRWDESIPGARENHYYEYSTLGSYESDRGIFICSEPLLCFSDMRQTLFENDGMIHSFEKNN